uniref:Uncharacterized protein n=1 Tax=Anguilla anguilla TaxID=7936 RepID=A0A0E9QW12_ANGAN
MCRNNNNFTLFIAGQTAQVELQWLTFCALSVCSVRYLLRQLVLSPWFESNTCFTDAYSTSPSQGYCISQSCSTS